MAPWNAVSRQVAVGLVIMGLGWGLAPARAQEDAPHPEERVSVGDFGGIGLLQMRTARFGPDGLFNIGYSRVDPYKRYALNIQILPGLEATFRYTEIRNRLYSPFAFFQWTANLQRSWCGSEIPIVEGKRILSSGGDRPSGYPGDWNFRR